METHSYSKQDDDSILHRLKSSMEHIWSVRKKSIHSPKRLEIQMSPEYILKDRSLEYFSSLTVIPELLEENVIQLDPVNSCSKFSTKIEFIKPKQRTSEDSPTSVKSNSSESSLSPVGKLVQLKAEEKILLSLKPEEKPLQCSKAEEKTLASVKAEEKNAQSSKAEEKTLHSIKGEDNTLDYFKAEEKTLSSLKAEVKTLHSSKAEEKVFSFSKPEEKIISSFKAEVKTLHSLKAEEKAFSFFKPEVKTIPSLKTETKPLPSLEDEEKIPQSFNSNQKILSSPKAEQKNQSNKLKLELMQKARSELSLLKSNKETLQQKVLFLTQSLSKLQSLKQEQETLSSIQTKLSKLELQQISPETDPRLPEAIKKLNHLESEIKNLKHLKDSSILQYEEELTNINHKLKDLQECNSILTEILACFKKEPLLEPVTKPEPIAKTEPVTQTEPLSPPSQLLDTIKLEGLINKNIVLEEALTRKQQLMHTKDKLEAEYREIPTNSKSLASKRRKLSLEYELSVNYSQLVTVNNKIKQYSSERN